MRVRARVVAGSGSGGVDVGDGEVVVVAVGVVGEVGVGRWLGLSGTHGLVRREDIGGPDLVRREKILYGWTTLG